MCRLNLKCCFGHLTGSTAVTPWKWSLAASITSIRWGLAEQGFQFLELTVVNPVISGSDFAQGPSRDESGDLSDGDLSLPGFEHGGRLVRGDL